MTRNQRSLFVSILVVLILTTAALTSGCAGLRAEAPGGLPKPAARPAPARVQPQKPAEPTARDSRAPVRAPAGLAGIEEIIHDARALYDLGLQHYERGEMDEARDHFDRAVERLTSVPGGARVDPRLADAYADLLRDIQEVETTSYQAGNGLSPASEPPPVDILDEIEPQITPEDAAKERELVQEATVPSDFPVVINDRVLAWIETYRGTLHERFQEGLTRSGRYIEMIQKVFAEEGLPEDLAYMAHVESAYKPYAYSRARAKGLWQFIVGTGTRYGLRRDWWIDERSDPELSTRAAAAYLKDLYAMFGDWYLAMAAYNAGEGKVQRGIDRTGFRDFWSLANTSHLRLETKNYVPAILAAIVISKNPEKFGFTLEREPRIVYDSVSIASATDLKVIATLAQTTVEDLRTLNPALARLQTPPNYPDFEIHVPVGSGEAFASAFRDLPASARIPWKSHTVRGGETLASISRRYGVSMSQVRQANGLGSSKVLQTGSVLQIPTYVAPPSGGHGDLLRPDSGSRGRSKVVHRVRRGETLSSIAGRYRTSVSNLRGWNGLGANGVIHPGDRLIVYGRSSGGSSPRTSTRASTSVSRLSASKSLSAGGGSSRSRAGGSNQVATYRVQRGDTLFKIANRLSTTVENICRINKLSLSEPLLPGTLIKVER